MEEKEEKLEFLKREEIQTMQKDLAQLREVEAQKERERISNLAVGQETKKPQVPENLPVDQTSTEKTEVEEETSVNLIPQRDQKPSFFNKKTLIRAGIALIFILLAGFSFWFFALRNRPPKEVILPKEETPNVNATTTATTTSETPGISETEALTPLITERIINWGYYIPNATRTIDTIIIHSTYNMLGGDLYDIEKVIQQLQTYKVAVHLLINRTGIIFRLVPDEYAAYHAGTGKMPDGSRKNIINNFSIGIELIYTKTDSPNEAQYQSLAQIVKYLKQKYNIASENILAAYQISPGRKDDPWGFNWDYFNSLIER